MNPNDWTAAPPEPTMRDWDEPTGAHDTSSVREVVDAHDLLEELTIAALTPDRAKVLNERGYLTTERRTSPNGSVSTSTRFSDKLRAEMSQTFDDALLHGNGDAVFGLLNHPRAVGSPSSARYDLPAHLKPLRHTPSKPARSKSKAARAARRRNRCKR